MSLCEQHCIKKLLDATSEAIEELYKELDVLDREQIDVDGAAFAASAALAKDREQARKDYRDKLASCAPHDQACVDAANHWMEERNEEFRRRENANWLQHIGAIRVIERKRKTAESGYVSTVAPTVGAQLLSCVAPCCGPPVGKPPKLPVLGAPVERIPEIVFMQKLNRVDKDLKSAEEFHHLWRLKIVKVQSLQEILEHLRSGRKAPKRIRIVAHGSGNHISLPLFRNMASGDLDSDLLRAFAAGNFALTRHVLLPPPQPPDLYDSLYETIREALERGSPEFGRLSHALGLDHPSAVVRDLALGMAASATTRSVGIRDAWRALITAGLAEVGVAQRDAVRDLEGEIVTLVAHRKLKIVLGQKDRKLVLAAATAVTKKRIRETVEKVRKLMKLSCIDVRGCVIGENPEKLLRPLSAIFGVEPDHITGPDVGDSYVKNIRVTSLGTQEDPNFGPTADHQLVKEAVAYWANVIALPKHARRRLPMLTRWPDMSSRQQLDQYLARMPVLPVFEGATWKDWQIVLRWLDDKKKDTALAKKIWVRSMWADAPAAQVDAIVKGWKPSRAPMFAYLEGDARGICPADPEFADHIKTPD